MFLDDEETPENDLPTEEKVEEAFVSDEVKDIKTVNQDGTGSDASQKDEIITEVSKDDQSPVDESVAENIVDETLNEDSDASSENGDVATEETQVDSKAAETTSHNIEETSAAVDPDEELETSAEPVGQDDIDALFGDLNSEVKDNLTSGQIQQDSEELTLDQLLAQESLNKPEDKSEEEGPGKSEEEMDPDELLALAWEKSMQESAAYAVNLDAFLSDAPSIGGNGLKELDQSEIDSLLGFGGSAPDPRSLTGIDAILNKTLIYYERLPMMEVVFDRLLRLLSTSLRNFTSDNVEISLESMKTTRFGDYLNSIPLPAMIGVFKAQEWDNSGILVVDSSLIYSIVDVLLGGRRSITAARVEGRPYTTIERNLIEKLMTVFLEELKCAFEPVSEVNFKFERLEINPHFAMISRSTNAGILVRLHIEIDDRGGRMSMMLPYATIEPIRELLLQNFMGEKFGRDSIWEHHLASQLWETDVDFNVRLDTTTRTLGEVLNWKAGDHLELSVTSSSLVSAISGDHELFKGHVGQKNGRVALKIEENILQKKMKTIAS